MWFIAIWAKYYGPCWTSAHISLPGSGETSKSKTLLYHCKDPEKPGVLLLGPIGISAANKWSFVLKNKK